MYRSTARWVGAVRIKILNLHMRGGAYFPPMSVAALHANRAFFGLMRINKRSKKKANFEANIPELSLSDQAH